MLCNALPRRRPVSQTGFFLLFVLAPPLDIPGIDLTRGHAVLLGMDWTLGIDALPAVTGRPAPAPGLVAAPSVMEAG